MNSSSFKDRLPDMHLINTSTPTSATRSATNATVNDVSPATAICIDESQHTFNNVVSNAMSSCFHSTISINQCFDNFAGIPLTLNATTEDQLSAFMLTKYENLLPTKESYYRRIALVQKIEQLLNGEWPNKDIKAILFGSSVNCLGTNQSDVDICITTQWSGLHNVETLARLFIQCGMQQVVCVPGAQVPIVRLFDPETQLACDININSTMALHNTKMIRTYVAIDPRVRPLAMMIKHWAKQRNLNDAANGGTLSTYTWTCMIISFLQMRQPPILPVLHQMKTDTGGTDEMFCTDIDKLRGFGQANCETLGGLLFAFFRRYAIEFDYDDQVVSVRHGHYLTKQEKGWHMGRNKASLCVEEPFNAGRNLGNSADARSIHGIRMELNRALEMLVAGVQWDYICSPYRRLCHGTLAPVYGIPNLAYHAVLPCLENIRYHSIAPSYHGDNYRNEGYIRHTTVEMKTPPPSLSPNSISSSSSSSPSASSLSSSSPPSSSSPSSPPPPTSLSRNHTPSHRSPREQQKIIDDISAKYVQCHILPDQSYYPYNPDFYKHAHRHQKKHSSSKRQPKRNSPANPTTKYLATTHDHQLDLGTLQRISNDLPHQQLQPPEPQRRWRQQLSTSKSESRYALDLQEYPLGSSSPYTIEIKLPTTDRIIIDNGKLPTHHASPALTLHNEMNNDGSVYK